MASVSGMFRVVLNDDQRITPTAAPDVPAVRDLAENALGLDYLPGSYIGDQAVADSQGYRLMIFIKAVHRPLISVWAFSNTCPVLLLPGVIASSGLTAVRALPLLIAIGISLPYA